MEQFKGRNRHPRIKKIKQNGYSLSRMFFPFNKFQIRILYPRKIHSTLQEGWTKIKWKRL